MNRRILNNSLWMMSEKIIGIFGLIFVTSYVAKYVGPSVFGSIAYALSIFQVVQIISQMGSDIIIMKRLSKKLESGVNLIYATFLLRMSIFCIIAAPILAWCYLNRIEYSFYYILAACISCFFSSLDVYSIYYDALLKSKFNTFINSLSLLVCLAIRWGIAYTDMPAVYLCIPIILTGLIPFFARYILFKSKHRSTLLKNRAKIKYSKYLLMTGSTFVFTSISVALYTRMSLFAIGFFESNAVVGIYSVAVTLAGSWSFVTNSFITSNLPGIFASKNLDDTFAKIKKLNILVLIITVIVVVCAVLFSGFFINLLYGEDYSESYWPLVILCLATGFSSLGTISARLIAKFSGYKYLSKKTVITLILSVLINLPSIYWFGIIGASISTLMTEFLSLTILNYFFNRKLILRSHLFTLFGGKITPSK